MTAQEFHVWGVKSVASPTFTSLLPSIFLPSPVFSPFPSHPFPSIFLSVLSLPTPTPKRDDDDDDDS